MSPLWPSISLITLDLDDTLWPCAPVIEAAEQDLFCWLRRHAPRLAAERDLHSLREHRLSTRQEYPEIAHDITQVRAMSLRTLLRQYGYPGGLAEQGVSRFLRVRNRVTPYPEVPSVLRSLARRYKLVAITNGNADVRETPLGEHFHYSLTAAEVGAARPAPELFHRALEWAGVGPESAAHVGDDPSLDVEAAQRLGIKTVWVNRSGGPWPNDLARPDVELRDLSDLA